MIKKKKIENSAGLYFVEGFDGHYYVVRMDSFRNVEARVPADTFKVIRMSARQNLEINIALQEISSDRSPEKIVDDIAKLHRGGVIVFE